jgi:hypothetical protein
MQVATEPQYVCGAARLGGHQGTESTSAHETDGGLRSALESGKKAKNRSEGAQGHSVFDGAIDRMDQQGHKAF